MTTLGPLAGLILFWSAAVLLLLSFFITRRRIGLLEGIVLWCFLLGIQNQYIWITELNLRWVQVSDQWMGALAYDGIRSAIVPFSMMLALEWSDRLPGRLRPLVWVGFGSLFAGIEIAAESLGVVIYGEKWKLWWTFAVWTAVAVLSAAALSLVRSLARKDVRP
ncbi:hypothetical protein H7B90_26030 [Cohnella xylanilytica]|uniref:Uncharacterized protein n=1 Tax=Cohnella xylanilytica TaxID=557555 RepID=A0A841UA70_9BACL|nr:hypothetical protein [Cohnella xylanilytica]